MAQTIALIVGYIASVFLAISLLVNNDLKFRWLNAAACLAFIVYGFFIHAFPIILTNAILFLIDALALVKIYRRNENFDLYEFPPGDELIKKFLSFYKKDIDNYFPEYKAATSENALRFVVLRDLVISNVFEATVMNDGTAFIQINYTTPKYRDYKIGKFLFQKEKQLLNSKGISRLVYTKVFNKNHEKYLIRMGFKKEMIKGEEHYFKSIE